MKTYHLQKRSPLPISKFPTNSIHSHSPHPLPTNIKLPKPKFPQSLPQKTHNSRERVYTLQLPPNTLYRIGCYYL